MARLTSQALIIGVGRLSNLLAAAGTMMVLARIIPDKESYGAIMLLIMMYMALSQIFVVGMPQAIYYFLPRYSREEHKGFLTQVFLQLVVSGVLLGIGFYFGAENISRVLNAPKLPELLRTFAWYPLFMLPTMVVESVLVTENRPLTSVIFGAVTRVVMFCTLVTPTWLHASLAETVRVWVTGAGVMGVIGVVLIFNTVRGLPWCWRREMLRETWAFALPLGALTMFNLASTNMDRFLVTHFYGPVAFGIYSNAVIEIPTVSVVMQATNVVLLAEYSRLTAVNDEKGLNTLWRSANIKTAILVLASLGFLAFWARETMLIIFSSRFAESGDIFRILVWTIPLYIVSLRSLFIAHGATLMVLRLTIIGMVISLLFTLTGGHFFGVKGIATGLVIAAYIINALWIGTYIRHFATVGWRHFLPWRELITTLALTLLAGGVTRLLGNVVIGSWPLLAVFAAAIPIFLLLYGSGLYVTGLYRYIVPTRFIRRIPTEIPVP